MRNGLNVLVIIQWNLALLELLNHVLMLRVPNLPVSVEIYKMGSFFAVGPVCFLSFSVEKVTNTCLSLLALYMFLDMDTSWLPITIFYKCCFYDLDLPLTVVCICIVMNESRCVNTDWGFICPYMNNKPFLKEKLISCWSFKANKDLSNVSVCFLFLLDDLKLGNKNKLILI